MIVLDTHTIIWWASDKNKLSKKAISAIRKAEKSDGFTISAISIWEIMMLLKKGRLRITMDPEVWLDHIEAINGLYIAPIDAVIARNSVILPDADHKDPVDRIIISTARDMSVPLVTADKKIRDYRHVATIW